MLHCKCADLLKATGIVDGTVGMQTRHPYAREQNMAKSKSREVWEGVSAGKVAGDLAESMDLLSLFQKQPNKEDLFKGDLRSNYRKGSIHSQGN